MRKLCISALVFTMLLTICGCGEKKKPQVSKSNFPCYKNVARQRNEDGWVFTFVYEYEKENVQPIDGLIHFYFFGFNVRYRYSDAFADHYTIEKKDGSTEEVSYQPGCLMWGQSQETASDSAKIDQLLATADKETLLALDADSLAFDVLDEEMFLRLMREALTGEPQEESDNQSYWDLPGYAALAEPEFYDEYAFQICFLKETGLVDVCYIDLLYQTGSGPTDYVQLSDIVEAGEATEDQIQLFQELQEISQYIEQEETFNVTSDKYMKQNYGNVDMERLRTFLNNIHKGEYFQYISQIV